MTVRKRPRSLADKRQFAAEIYRRLFEHYPDAHCALDFKTPFQLLIATILSAQCTDKRVNMVTPALFKRYPTPASLAAAKPEKSRIIRPPDFSEQGEKFDRHGHGSTEQHDDRAGTMDALVKLPGVGRKTANDLATLTTRTEGVVVDAREPRRTAPGPDRPDRSRRSNRS